MKKFLVFLGLFTLTTSAFANNCLQRPSDYKSVVVKEEIFTAEMFEEWIDKSDKPAEIRKLKNKCRRAGFHASECKVSVEECTETTNDPLSTATIGAIKVTVTGTKTRRVRKTRAERNAEYCTQLISCEEELTAKADKDKRDLRKIDKIDDLINTLECSR